ncbi:hypothetical protein ACH5RR_013061 [Cinchona calisaya]|uniref:Uncharacterized protein n=1 Tax=Cinchona calisaya TaxID=153742 RepID=A0ABD3A096_9GENT
MPYDLIWLYSGTDEESMEFKKNIRTHNVSLAFTSFGAKYDHELTKNTKELYYYDTEEELSRRLDVLPRLRDSIAKLLMNVLGQNPYAKFFKSLRDIPNLENQTIVLSSNPSLDRHAYNLPSYSEVVDINPKMKNWSAKVTVQEKLQATPSSKSKTTYHKFIFVDSRDSKVQGIMFNQAISVMIPKLLVYKKYLISNTEVRLNPKDFCSDGIDTQLVMSTETILEEQADEQNDMHQTDFVYTKFKGFQSIEIQLVK